MLAKLIFVWFIFAFWTVALCFKSACFGGVCVVNCVFFGFFLAFLTSNKPVNLLLTAGLYSNYKY